MAKPKQEEVEEIQPIIIEVPKETEKKKIDLDLWKPKTEIGRKVKSGEIKDINEILDKGMRVLEPEIVDILIPNMESIIIGVGQSKGKFGGGKRSVWRQTQKKTAEGNKPKFATVIAVGNKDGYVGIGKGKAKETVPAREKATRKAKLNLIKIRRGCGSWECECGEAHSIPFKIEGKCGSVRMTLIPAPKGTGLCVEKECKKILELAGIKDIYSRTFGQTRTKINHVYACFEALKKLGEVRIPEEYRSKAGIKEGRNE
ncbi:MAG: 30S ribosomal protein S5 [Candidatus Nanoarchaeia archaeon]